MTENSPKEENTMPSPNDALRECHRLRRHINNLQEELKRLPVQIKAQHTKATNADKGYHEAQEALKKLKVTITGHEKDLRETHQQIDKYKRQLNESKGTKEFDALKTEIATAQAKAQSLEETILTEIGQSEEDAAKLPELDKGVKKAKEDAAQFEKNALGRKQLLEEELARTQQALVEMEALLPGDMGEQYRRLIKAKGNDALSIVTERTCTACYTSITAQNYNDLAQGKPLICKACGRMLYLPE
jgi:predicted  nucleic acid-binding Zn-ribbon protein